MPEVLISRIRGMNSSDPPTSLPPDIATLAQNVEWVRAPLGQRRLGTLGLNLTGSGLTSHEFVSFLATHYPGVDVGDATLFALGVTGTSSCRLEYKDTAWHLVTPNDAISLANNGAYRLYAQTFKHSLFVMYDSAVDRAHVFDGTDLRRVGLDAPASAPALANTGGGTYAGKRYARYRYTRQDGSGNTIQRSEPSAEASITPSGAGSGITVTRGSTAAADPGVTHWEAELSVDAANWFVVATTAIGTAAITDTTPYTPGYSDFPTSEDIGDYTLPWSAEFVMVDADRVIFLGSRVNTELASTVGWTPVTGASGVGNSERFEADTDPYLHLDPGIGGGITGHSNSINGVFYVFKLGRIYRFVRTGKRLNAYEAFLVSDARGAIKGSIVNGVDQAGRPCVYFMDPEVGACRMGYDGLKVCGEDIRDIWDRVNPDATVPARTVFHRRKKQWHLWVALDGASTPNYRVVLHTRDTREVEDGVRGGWAVWPGESAEALAVTLFADNINAGVARSRKQVPLIGKVADGFIQLTDTGTDDNGSAFAARLVTRPYSLGNFLTQVKVAAGLVAARAAAGVSFLLKTIRDIGLETPSSKSVDLTPSAAAEPQVFKLVDSLRAAECRTVQFEVADEIAPTGTWEVNALVVKYSDGKTTG